MGAFLGLAAAVAFGISDFVSGLAARTLHYVWVTLLGQAVGACLAWLSLLWFGGAGPHAGTVLWGATSGLGTAVGTLALFRGYGHGQMAVAGPLSAIGAAAVPAVTGLLLGDQLSALGVGGVLLALPAIWLMSRTSGRGAKRIRTGVVDGLVSGLGFGVMFIALSFAGDRSGLWPIAAGQTVALVVVASFAVLLRPAWSGSATSRATRLSLAAGLVSVSATILYFQATHLSLLIVAAVLTSLYPGVTVALAATLLHERPGAAQRAGIALGAVAVVAIVLA